MKGIILYQSKYGATKKYADWISEATGFECVETKKANIKEVEKYDIIVLGGGIYAMGIAGLSFLKRKCYTVLTLRRCCKVRTVYVYEVTYGFIRKKDGVG